MPYNSAAYSFAPNAPVPIQQFQVNESVRAYNNLTTAQLTSMGLTPVSISANSTSVLVDAAKQRTKGIYLVTPSDQPQATVANVPAGGIDGLTPLPQGPITPFNQTQTSTTNNNGFGIPSGIAIDLMNYNDVVYACTPAGVAGVIFFLDH